MNFEKICLDLLRYLEVYTFSDEVSFGSKTVALALVFFFFYLIGLGLWLATQTHPLIRLIKQLSNPELLLTLSENAELFRAQQVNSSPYALYEGILRRNSIGTEGSRKDVIIKHLQSIFVAGCREATLEPASLLRHTEHQIFQGTARIKNLLGSFIILGLLGTLMGLALSLEQLPTDLTGNGGNSTELLTSLQTLVRHLKYAFFPSILGIIFTLIGFVLYGGLANSVLNPLKGELEKSTINCWIPYLFPAYSQRLIEKLESNASRMDAHFKDITLVTEFASQINKETSDFKQNLVKGNQLVKGIQGHAGSIEAVTEALRKNFTQKLEKFSDDFAMTVTDLTKSQGKFVKLQTGVDSALIEFKNHLIVANNAQAESFNQVRGTIDQSIQHFGRSVDIMEQNINTLNTEVSKTLKALQQNESTFIEKFNIQNDLINTLIAEVSDSVHSETINNRKVAEEILSTSHTIFTDIDETLKINLQNILGRFDRYDAPVQAAANKIENTYSGFVKLVLQIIDNNSNKIDSSQSAIKDALIEHLSQLNLGFENERGAMSTRSKELNELTKAITSLNDNMSKSILRRLFS